MLLCNLFVFPYTSERKPVEIFNISTRVTKSEKPYVDSMIPPRDTISFPMTDS